MLEGLSFVSGRGWEYEAGRWRTLPKLVVSSPLLPLPVELVAGGEGNPDSEPFESAPGLGGGFW